MFTIVVPPDYAEELQQICTLDASQREKLISLLALGVAWTGKTAAPFSA